MIADHHNGNVGGNYEDMILVENKVGMSLRTSHNGY